MEQLLTRKQLAAAAERAFRTTFPDLARREKNAISERTIRYWTKEGLLEHPGGPNQLALYEPEIAHRCVLIRRLKLEENLTLANIRRTLREIDADTIRRVATGKERLHIAFADSPGAASRMLKDNEQVVTLPQSAMPRGKMRPDYGDKVGGRPTGLQDVSDFEKGNAIAAALTELTGQSFTIDIESTDNSGFAHRSSLRSPCRISLLAKLDVTAEDCAPAIERIQRVSDTDICIAIAKELSQRTSEPYLVELSTKRYLQQRPLKMRDTDCGMRMSFFVARADS